MAGVPFLFHFFDSILRRGAFSRTGHKRVTSPLPPVCRSPPKKDVFTKRKEERACGPRFSRKSDHHFPKFRHSVALSADGVKTLKASAAAKMASGSVTSIRTDLD
ncbi:hypothetical protein MRX96_012061 [Rhipicephalus microplus]